jgi:hypothetical protein
MNIGEMFNQGLEVSIGADVINKAGFVWNLNLNASTV